jgi:protein-glutamine gamma-glutamyltransferase
VSRWTALPLGAAIVLFGAVSPTSWVALGLGAVLLLAVLLPARATATRLVEGLFSTFLLVIGTVVLTTLLPPGRANMTMLRGGWAAFAAALLLVAVARFFLAAPFGRDGMNLALCLVAVTVCGGALTGALYPTAVATILLLAFVARRQADDGRAPLEALGKDKLAPTLALLAVAAGIAIGAITALPPMHEWAMRQMWIHAVPKTGFSDRLWLGSMRGMLLSDEKVMRIRGENVDHVRGVAYSIYEAGRWSTGPDTMTTFEPPTLPRPGDDMVEIEILDDDPRRYFFPLGAGDVAVSSGFARVDRHGVIAPIAAEPALRLWYRPLPEDLTSEQVATRGIAVAPPDEHDLAIPSDVRPFLNELLGRWRIGRGDPRATLDAIQQRLQSDYAYSLVHERGRHHDATVDFLFSQKQGHCEYFASSFALLGRAVGIPTRVVGGYRVFERNPIGEYWIVRERNAHAWVEIWLDGRWTTWDPTPPGELISTMQGETPWMAALVDLGGTAWAAFLSWLDRRSWTEMGVGASIVLLTPLLLRWLWGLRNRRREEDELGDGPLPCFDTLSDRLARHGVRRATSETVEQLANRVDDASDLPPELQEAAELLRRYAALRYGGLGDHEGLDRDIGSWAGRVDASADGALTAS